MFLKFICKAFFAKNIVKTGRNSRINGLNCISALFAGHSTTFRQNRRPFPGKPGSTAATNTAGKNGLLRGQNKAERNCRYTQDIQQIKSRSCRTKTRCGSFCFSVWVQRRLLLFFLWLLLFKKALLAKALKILKKFQHDSETGMAFIDFCL